VTWLESSYYTDMRFDGGNARNVLSHYVRYFEGGGRVLELGPGRGEFLGLLGEAGIEAVGVDVDEGMVRLARAAGLDVELGDAVDYVERVAEPGSFGGVFSAHFVEHFPTRQVERLLAGCRRVLAPGGRMVAVTPNPASYPVLSHDFWRDPTHVRFYDLPLLEFLCRRAGLDVVGGGVNPRNAPGPRPEFVAAEPAVQPGLDDPVEELVAALRAAPRAGDVAGPDAGPGAGAESDRDWRLMLAHLVNTLAGRLQQTQEELRALWRAHDMLLRDLYQANEIYVVAEMPRIGAVGSAGDA
jgi:SAM-dependent methyltransferase